MKRSISAFTTAAISGAAITKFLAVAAIATTASVFNADRALALCASYGPPPGSWVNVDPNTREITRIRIQYSCNDTLAIPADATPAEREALRSRLGQAWTVRLWGKCHPSDCSWGSANAEAMRSGDADNIVASYDQGFATRRAVMRMRGGQMQLILTSTYRDGRPSRKTSSWFFHASR